MLNKEQVTWLFRLVLEREPDSEQVIEHFQATYENVETARTHLLQSNEFFRNHLDRQVFYNTHDPCSLSDKTLAVACIVKNEERHIAEMLKSILPLVRYISLVDTGSTDATVSIAVETIAQAHIAHTIQSIDFVHFSHARNVALEAVPGNIDWILMLDADERIVRWDYLKLHRLMSCRRELDAWCLPRYNFLDQSKVKPVLHYPDYQKRLLRNRSFNPIRYIGLVHETLINVTHLGLAPMCDLDRSGSSGGPHIHHFGLVDQAEERASTKAALYAELTRQATQS